jgi:ABC-2 type transport system permease protein
MNLYRHEARLLLRSPAALGATLLLALLCTIAVVSGLSEARRQQQTIAKLEVLQQDDLRQVARQHGAGNDPGNAAYYSFHGTWNPPSGLAFAAIGQRDIAPFVLRVRALGLHAQLYEGETFNPESALPGRFDFAFVLVYLVPLCVIALLHDLISSERETGRLRTLAALQGAMSSLWWHRVSLRFAMLLAAILLPFVTGAAIAGAELSAILGSVLLATLYVAIWCAIATWLASFPGSSATQAARLLGVWVLITLLLPTLSQVLLTRAIPADSGVDLVMAHREAVHGSWEIPRERTMEQFFQRHPEWKHTAPLAPTFEWKWYLAFHQVADESVAAQVAAYRQALRDRERWTERIGYVLPAVATNTLLHRLADSDLTAQLDYQESIAAFHERLRKFFYPYLFEKRPFPPQDYLAAPGYQAMERSPRAQYDLIFAMVLVTALVAWLARARVAKEDGQRPTEASLAVGARPPQ